MGQIIAFVNSFKNTGKTQSALKLAKVYTGYGMRMLLVDLDPQGNLSANCSLPKPIISWYSQLKSGAHIEPRHVGDLMDILPADKDMAMAEFDSDGQRLFGLFKAQFPSFAHAYDGVILDCPPSTGVLTQLACNLADILCVPIIAENVYPQGLSKLRDVILEHDLKAVVSFFPKNLNNTVNFESKAAPIQSYLLDSVFPQLVSATHPEENHYHQYGLVDAPSLFMALHGV